MVAGRVTTEETWEIVFAELDANEDTAAEIARRYGISYRTLMRRCAERRASRAAPPPPAKLPPKPPPPLARVVVVSGDVLATARRGLEAGIEYLTNVATNLDPALATPPEIRAVGESIVKVLSGVVETLESALRRDSNQTDATIATMNDEQLIAEAKRLASARAAEKGMN